MKLIDKHLLREYLVPLFYCLCGFCMLYVIVGLFDLASDLLKAKVSFHDVLFFYVDYLVAYTEGTSISFLVIILPVSLLAGTLYSLSLLTRHNELTAMCASGVSLYRLMYPFLGVGLACSVLAVFLQEVLAPPATRRVDEFVQRLEGKDSTSARIFRNWKYYNQDSHRRWQVEEFDLARPTRLTGVQVTTEREDMTRIASISADSAMWRRGHWWFVGKNEQRYLPDDEPDGGPTGPEPHPVKMAELTETPEDFMIEADSHSLEKYSSTPTLLRYLRKRGSLQADELARKTVDAHTRLAMPWACLVVALLAIPAGTRGGRQSVLAGINFAVMLFLAFYMTFHVAAVLGKKQIIWPGLSAWLPNMIFCAVGIVMVSRIRH